jgi:hypothetical protein
MLENGPEEIVGSKDIKFGPSIYPIYPFFGSASPPWKENGLDPFYQRFSAGIIHLSIGIPVPAGLSRRLELPLLLSLLRITITAR